MHSSRRLSFTIQDRPYYHHRPQGCTVILIEHEGWSGNEFGLWLPESALSWGNWETAGSHQNWVVPSGDEAIWHHVESGAELVSTLKLDQAHECVRYSHAFTNTSRSILRDVNAQTCLHLVNAPQFISIRGERIWACLDGEWKTTDLVPRDQSIDPNRVRFLREGKRSERTIVHSTGFPYSTMPEAASHPLIIAESFDGRRSVGIACRDMAWLFNNNDYILRCIHSEPNPIAEIRPGETALQEGIIMFSEGDHADLIDTFGSVAPAEWSR